MRKIASFLLRNTSTKQTIAKNAFWLFVGQLLARLIKIGILAYAARVLGVAEWGTFSYAMSVAALITLLMDFGINAIITRESVRDASVQETYFATAFVLKSVLFVVAIAVACIVPPIVFGHGPIASIVPIVVFMFGLDGFRDFGASMARAREKMEIESFVHIVTNILIVVFGVAALAMSATAKSLAWGYVLGVGIGTIMAFFPFRSYFKTMRQSFKPELIKKIFITCWPFGMLGLMGVILTNVDSVMIGWWRDIVAVGYYGAIQRIVQLVYIVPSLISVAFFPAISRLVDDKPVLRAILERGISILTLLAVPLTVGSIVLGPEIIRILFGDAFMPAAPAFQILALSFLPVFLSSMLASAAFALNRERLLLKYVIFGVVGNFLLNLALIPTFGIEGASWSTVINLSLVTAYLVVVLKKQFGFRIWRQIDKIVVATLILAASTIVAKHAAINVYATVGIAGILYIATLIILKEESLSEILQKVKTL